MSEAEARQRRFGLTAQNHCLAAKGAGLFLDLFTGEHGRVQLGQVGAAELLQLANLILLSYCGIHHCLVCLLRLRQTCHRVRQADRSARGPEDGHCIVAAH